MSIRITILDKVKRYYKTQSSDLNSFLEKTSFLETNAKYPNSVVIKFGINKILGEVSIWQHSNESYIEFEYVNLMKLDEEPVCLVKTVDSESVIDELTKQFDDLRRELKKDA
jgi:predicted AlkP superfamily phosphohydrolase/phosphomutase